MDYFKHVDGDDCQCDACVMLKDYASEVSNQWGKTGQMSFSEDIKKQKERHLALGGQILYSSLDVGGGLIFKTEESPTWYTIKRLDVNLFEVTGGNYYTKKSKTFPMPPRETAGLEAGRKVDFLLEGGGVAQENVIAIQRVGTGRW